MQQRRLSFAVKFKTKLNGYKQNIGLLINCKVVFYDISKQLPIHDVSWIIILG